MTTEMSLKTAPPLSISADKKRNENDSVRAGARKLPLKSNAFGTVAILPNVLPPPHPRYS